ncbi:MAG TPA: SPOR domain-containing protein [Fibrobacteraceae bacterium]|nr:SPOR domain-containing protein [Fibrobacteraceae bacterium]
MKIHFLPLLFLGVSALFAENLPPLPPVPAPESAFSADTPSSASGQIQHPRAPSNCAAAKTLRTKADSLFALGDWARAAVFYEQICDCGGNAARRSCLLQWARSIAQDSTRITEALQTLDSLSILVEPEDPEFGELMLAQIPLYLGQHEPERALKAWHMARQVAMEGQEENLKALCTQIISQQKDPSLTNDCSRLPALAKPLAQALTSSTIGPSSSATTSAPLSGGWVLQFGAFSNKDNAELLSKNLLSRKVPTRMVTRNTSEKVLWLVQTEPFADKKSALDYGARTIQPLGLEFQALPAQ